MSPNIIETALNEHLCVFESIRNIAADIEACADQLADVLKAGGRVFICGNGGSAADSQHFAAELSGRFEMERRGYPAIALTTDTSALTAIGNDYGFDCVFERQLEAHGKAGDLLIAISTSGNSANVLRAVESARKNDIFSIGLLGRDGGALADTVDKPLIVDAERTTRIQEAHIFILHILCEIFEARL